MKVKIDRNNRKIQFVSGAEFSASKILNRKGFKSVNPLNIENYDDIAWDGNEFNRLFVKDGKLYRFNHWICRYPYEAIEIEEIGYIL